MDHRYRGQVAVQVADADLRFPFLWGRDHLRRHELLAAQDEAVRPPAHARFHHRRGGQGRHVQHRPRSQDLLDGVAHGRVRHLYNHPHRGPELAGQQRRLQTAKVRFLHTHDSLGALQPSVPQRLAEPCATRHMGDSPLGDDGDQFGVGVVVDHDNRHVGQVEELYDTEAQAL